MVSKKASKKFNKAQSKVSAKAKQKAKLTEKIKRRDEIKESKRKGYKAWVLGNCEWRSFSQLSSLRQNWRGQRKRRTWMQNSMRSWPILVVPYGVASRLSLRRMCVGSDDEAVFCVPDGMDGEEELVEALNEGEEEKKSSTGESNSDVVATRGEAMLRG